MALAERHDRGVSGIKPEIGIGIQQFRSSPGVAIVKVDLPELPAVERPQECGAALLPPSRASM
jgi:hypothetical protein